MAVAKGNRQFIAVETFMTDNELVQQGITRVREGHELLKKYPEWFTPIDDVAPHYETAATSPGAPRD